MSALTKFFFRAPYSRPTTLNVIRWWESRRPVYNLAVGSAGLFTLTVVTVLDFGRAGMGIPLGVVLGYAIMANLFYCLGPVADAWITRKWGPNYSAVGPTLFRYGFVFAVGLTLLPIPMVFFGYLMRFLVGR